jgi:hypothetical protein
MASIYNSIEKGAFCISPTDSELNWYKTYMNDISIIYNSFHSKTRNFLPNLFDVFYVFLCGFCQIQMETIQGLEAQLKLYSASTKLWIHTTIPPRKIPLPQKYTYISDVMPDRYF